MHTGYATVRNEKREDNRYEYSMEIDNDVLRTTYEKSVSPGIIGDKIVEKYVSMILGKKTEFFLIQGSRFFSKTEIFEKQSLNLTLSISEIEENAYWVLAEITDNENILIEVNGNMSAKS